MVIFKICSYLYIKVTKIKTERKQMNKLTAKQEDDLLNEQEERIRETREARADLIRKYDEVKTD